MSTAHSMDEGPRGKPGGYLWVALSVTFAAVLAQPLAGQSISVLYPFIQSELELSHAQVGLITSAFAIGFVIVGVLAGWLSDTLGVKRIAVISLLLMTAFTVAFPLAHSFLVVLFLMSFIGIVSSPVYPATSRAIMDWFPTRIRALAMGVIQTGIPVGGALTAAVLPALALVIGWRLAAASAGMLILVIAIAFAAFYRDAPRGKEPANRLNLATFRTILKNRPLVMTLIWGATFLGLHYTILSYFMLFLIEKLGIPPVAAGGLLAAAQVSSSIMRILWGAASDFVFRGRRIAVLAITGLLTAAWMLGASAIGSGSSGITVLLLAVGMGISTLAFHGVQTTLVGELAGPGQVGMTLGISSMWNHISMMLLPPLFGYLVDISGSYSLGWRVTAAMALACTLALLAFGREAQRR